jgi:glycosyltransferase involved in cell wall biosynthesis
LPYLIVSGIPFFVDQRGQRWTDGLWHKDLIQHLEYIEQLTIAAPKRRMEPAKGAKCLSDDPRFAAVHYVDLPPSDSFAAGLLNWPRTFGRLWSAVGTARIVHVGVADWPIPIGWAATLAAKLRRRFLLINIESAFWRAPRSASFAKRAHAWLWERINRWCVRRAALPLFTHHEYAREMLPRSKQHHVLQASWIDDENVLDEHTASLIWDIKDKEECLSLLFAGRLIREKGVEDLLEAMVGLPASIRLDLIGEGALTGEVNAAARTNECIKLLRPVEYGEPFFELMRKYHAVVVPSRTDEQPRIVYDAYSQAVPVLATRTAGNVECVIQGQTGYLIPVGEPAALRDAFKCAQSDRLALRAMGIQGLGVARSYTHQEMHRKRWALLNRLIRPNVPVRSS